MEKESDRDAFVEDLKKQAKQIYNQSSLSKEDQSVLNTAIDNIKKVSSENEVAMEEVVAEAFGLMQMYSTKAMYLNMKELNKAAKDDKEMPVEVSRKMIELESALGMVVKGMEERDLSMFETNIEKVNVISAELSEIKEKFGL